MISMPDSDSDASALHDDPREGEAPAPEVDERLWGAHDLALAALHEITPAATVGPPAGHRAEADGVVSLRFENRLPGYPGWYWTVSLARVADAEPTVLEVEMLPDDGALLAPEWVPWATRLAEYHAHQATMEAGQDAGATEDEAFADAAELEDTEDLDAADFDLDGSPILHSGDVDGVDIDELDETADDDDPDRDDFDDDASDDLDDDDASDEDAAESAQGDNAEG